MLEAMTSDCLRLLGNNDISKEYRNCLKEFIEELIMLNPNNIKAIVLFGGIVRDARVFKVWSDIDIIVIFNDIIRRDAIQLALLLNRLRASYSVRIDLTQVSLKELTNDQFLKCLFNSELINALSMRENVSVVLYGSLPSIKFTQEQEQKASIFYITNTLALFRRYLIEVLFRNNIDNVDKNDIMRVVRWTFSIVRASLRLFNIFSHPYEYSLPHVRQLFPDLDLSLLNKLIDIRKDISSVVIKAETVREVELFIENYVFLVLQKYYGDSNHEKNQ